MSHHFDTPTAIEDGRIDLCDVYVFPGKDPNNTVFILTVNPDAGLSSPTTFRSEGLYEFKIDTNGDAIEDLSYCISFKEPDTDGIQRLEVRLAEGIAAQSGTGGRLIAEGQTNVVTSVIGNGKVWAGLAADAFVGDAIALAKFMKALKNDQFDLTGFETPDNFFAQRNITGIVLEIPTAAFGAETIHLWATVSLSGHAPQIQVSRMAKPLMTHIFCQDETQRENYNRSHPKDDVVAYSASIATFVAKVTTLAQTTAAPTGYGRRVAQLLLPNVLTYQLGTPASYGFAGLNGRSLSDDVYDVTLTIAANKPLTDSVNANHRYRAEFPYLGLPYEIQTGVPSLIERQKQHA